MNERGLKGEGTVHSRIYPHRLFLGDEFLSRFKIKAKPREMGGKERERERRRKCKLDRDPVSVEFRSFSTFSLMNWAGSWESFSRWFSLNNSCMCNSCNSSENTECTGNAGVGGRTCVDCQITSLSFFF